MKQYFKKNKYPKNDTILLHNDHAAMSNFFPFYNSHYENVVKYEDSGERNDVIEYDALLEDFLKRGISRK